MNIASGPDANATATERMLSDLVNAVQRRLNANGLGLLFSIVVWPEGEPEKAAVASTLDPTRRREIEETFAKVLARWHGAGR